MPCTQPHRYWVHPEHEEILLSPKAGCELDPSLFDTSVPHRVVPCGHCERCRRAHSRDWATRCWHESQTSSRSCFLTLTYSDANLPYSRSLVHEHWQIFARALRRHVGSFRYLMCGEYGPKTLRPHYHALIYGLDFKDDRVRKADYTGSDNNVYLSPKLLELWSHGYHLIGDVTPQSAAYVAQYVNKKAKGPLKYQAYERLDPSTGEFWNVEPEYLRSSTHPGLGHDWLARHFDEVYPSDFIIDQAGHKLRPPRYYDKLCERWQPDLYEQVKARRTSGMIAAFKGAKHQDRQWQTQRKNDAARKKLYGDPAENRSL